MKSKKLKQLRKVYPVPVMELSYQWTHHQIYLTRLEVDATGAGYCCGHRFLPGEAA
ncbi:hypothetical protein D3C81_787260 [compost metagenome]